MTHWPSSVGRSGLRWCLRRQAARALRPWVCAVALRAPGLQSCLCTFGRRHRKTRPTVPPPLLHARVGGRLAAYICSCRCGPTLLVVLRFLARVVGHLLLRFAAVMEEWGGCWDLAFSLVPGRRGRVGAPAKHAPSTLLLIYGACEIPTPLLFRYCGIAWAPVAARHAWLSGGSSRPLCLHVRVGGPPLAAQIRRQEGGKRDWRDYAGS